MDSDQSTYQLTSTGDANNARPLLVFSLTEPTFRKKGKMLTYLPSRGWFFLSLNFPKLRFGSTVPVCLGWLVFHVQRGKEVSGVDLSRTSIRTSSNPTEGFSQRISAWIGRRSICLPAQAHRNWNWMQRMRARQPEKTASSTWALLYFSVLIKGT
jgi:hypothetical protein